MPLPLYQPTLQSSTRNILKRGTNSYLSKSSLNQLDDNCLSKILEYALLFADSDDDFDKYTFKSLRVEQNLSLVCKRWYFLTQSLVTNTVRHKIFIDNLKNVNSFSSTSRKNKSNLSAKHSGSGSRGKNGSTRLQVFRPVLRTSNSNNRRASIKLYHRPTTSVSITKNVSSPKAKSNRGTAVSSQTENKNLSNASTINKLSSSPDINVLNVATFKKLRFKLMKYKRIALIGSVNYDEYCKLMLMVNLYQVEDLELNLSIQRNKKIVDKLEELDNDDDEYLDLSYFQKKSQVSFVHLKRLLLRWSDEQKMMTSNSLTLNVLQSAPNLESLSIYLTHADVKPETLAKTAPPTAKKIKISYNLTNGKFGLKKASKPGNILLDALSGYRKHRFLTSFEFIFKNTTTSSNSDSADTSNNSDKTSPVVGLVQQYVDLITAVLNFESSIKRLKTNELSIIEHLLQSKDIESDDIYELNILEISSPIRSLSFLTLLFESDFLTNKRLSVIIEDVNYVSNLVSLLEQHDKYSIPQQSLDIQQLRKKTTAPLSSSFLDDRDTDQQFFCCQVQLHLIDQKMAYIEEKVGHLANLCRLASVEVFISLNQQQQQQQRLSIDCCHLMWSLGKALQILDCGMCLFRINSSQLYGKAHTITNQSTQNNSLLTIPFGKCRGYTISLRREDMTRRKGIIKAIKKRCYNEFLKNVRDNQVYLAW